MIRISFIPCLITLVLLAIAPADAQQPPPPPPPDAAGGLDNPSAGNLDLNTIPVPEADANAAARGLTEEERKGPMVKITIIPIGDVPPPILYLDKDGMPREQYRDPLEYAPSIYRIKTKQDAVTILAAQNQVGPLQNVPRRPALELSYQSYPAADNNNKDPAKPADHGIGTIIVPPAASHLAVILWKDPGDKLWNNPRFRVVDISPGVLAAGEMIAVNAAGTNLAVAQADKPMVIRDGFMGKIRMPVTSNNQMVLRVYAADGQAAEPLVQTSLQMPSTERLFLLAWKVPKDRTRPTGVAISPITRAIVP